MEAEKHQLTRHWPDWRSQHSGPSNPLADNRLRSSHTGNRSQTSAVFGRPYFVPSAYGLVYQPPPVTSTSYGYSDGVKSASQAFSSVASGADQASKVSSTWSGPQRKSSSSSGLERPALRGDSPLLPQAFEASRTREVEHCKGKSQIKQDNFGQLSKEVAASEISQANGHLKEVQSGPRLNRSDAVGGRTSAFTSRGHAEERSSLQEQLQQQVQAAARNFLAHQFQEMDSEDEKAGRWKSPPKATEQVLSGRRAGAQLKSTLMKKIERDLHGRLCGPDCGVNCSHHSSARTTPSAGTPLELAPSVYTSSRTNQSQAREDMHSVALRPRNVPEDALDCLKKESMQSKPKTERGGWLNDLPERDSDSARENSWGRLPRPRRHSEPPQPMVSSDNDMHNGTNHRAGLSRLGKETHVGLPGPKKAEGTRSRKAARNLQGRFEEAALIIDSDSNSNASTPASQGDESAGLSERLSKQVQRVTERKVNTEIDVRIAAEKRAAEKRAAAPEAPLKVPKGSELEHHSSEPQQQFSERDRSLKHQVSTSAALTLQIQSLESDLLKERTQAATLAKDLEACKEEGSMLRQALSKREEREDAIRRANEVGAMMRVEEIGRLKEENKRLEELVGGVGTLGKGFLGDKGGKKKLKEVELAKAEAEERVQELESEVTELQAKVKRFEARVADLHGEVEEEKSAVDQKLAESAEALAESAREQEKQSLLRIEAEERALTLEKLVQRLQAVVSVGKQEEELKQPLPDEPTDTPVVKEVSELESRKKEIEEEIEILEMKRISIEQEVADLLSQQEQLRCQLAQAVEQEIADIRSHLKAELASLQTEKEGLEVAISTLKEAETSKDSLAEEEAELVMADLKEDHKQQVFELQALLGDSQHRLADVAEALAACQVALSAREQEVAGLQEAAQELRTMCSEQEDTIDVLKAENERVTTKAEKEEEGLKNDIASMGVQIDKLKQQLERQSETVSSLQACQVSLQVELGSALAAARSAERQLAESERQVAETETQLTEIKKKEELLGIVQKAHQTIRRDMGETDKVLRDMRTRYREAEASLEKGLQDAKAAQDRAESEAQTLANSLQNLQTTLSETQEKLNQTSALLFQSQAEYATLKDTHETAQEGLSRRLAQLAEAEGKLRGLEKTVEEIQVEKECEKAGREQELKTRVEIERVAVLRIREVEGGAEKARANELAARAQAEVYEKAATRAAERAESLEKESADVRQQRDLLTAQLSQALADVSTSQARADSASREAEALSSALAKSQQALEMLKTLEGKLRASETEAGAAKDRAEALEVALRKGERRVGELESEVTGVSRERDRCQLALDRLEAEAEKRKAEVRERQQQVKQLVAVNEAMVAESARREQKLQAVERQVAALQAEVEKLRAELEETRDELEEARQDGQTRDYHCQLLTGKLSEAGLGIRGREAEIERLEKDLGAFRAEQEALSSELQRLNGLVEGQAGDLERARGALLVSEGKDAAARTEAAAWKERVAELEEKVRGLSRELMGCKEENMELLERVESREKEAEEARSKALQEGREREYLQSKLAKLEEEVMEKEGQISILRGSIQGEDSFSIQ